MMPGMGYGGYGMMGYPYMGSVEPSGPLPSDRIRPPDIADALMKGMAFRQQMQDQATTEQERQNQLAIQKYQMQAVQRNAVYQQGQDILASGDKDKWTKYQTDNPILAKQVQAESDLNDAKMEEVKDTLFKSRVATLNWDDYKNPDTQAQLSKVAPGKLPTFKDENSFTDWQNRVLGGPAAKKSSLDIMKEGLEVRKAQLDLAKGAQALSDKQRGPFNYGDAFIGVKAAVENDPELKKLADDPINPTTGKVMMAGPRTYAITQITNVARDLFHKFPGMDTETAEETAMKLYKVRHDPKSSAALQQNIDILRKNPKDKKLQEQFDKNPWGLPHELFLGSDQ